MPRRRAAREEPPSEWITLEVSEERLVRVPEQIRFNVSKAASAALGKAGFKVVEPGRSPAEAIVSLSYSEQPANVRYGWTRVGVPGREERVGGTDIQCGLRVTRASGEILLDTAFHDGFKEFAGGNVDSDPEVLLYGDACLRFRFSTLFSYLGELVLVALGKMSYADLLARILQRDDRDSYNLHERAILMLDELRPDVQKTAVPVLVEFLETGPERASHGKKIAVDMLGNLARTHLQALRPALESKNVQVRADIVAAISKAGEDAIGALTSALRDGESRVRLAAVEALKDIGTDLAAAALGPGLTDPDFDVRRNAALALAQCGAAGLHELIGALDSEAEQTQRAALIGLHQMGAAAQTAVQSLATLLHTSLCSEAADTLGAMGSAAASAIPTLLDLVSTGEANARMSAARALGNIAQHRLEVGDRLTEAMEKEGNPYVRDTMAYAAKQIGTHGASRGT